MFIITDHLKSDKFDLFYELLDECAVLIVNLAKANNLDNIMQELVKIIDPTKVFFYNTIIGLYFEKEINFLLFKSGFLIRKRVVQVLKQFLERNKKLNLHEPLECK